MPKFTAELDTDTKQSKFYIDGQEINAADYSIGSYQFSNYKDDGSTEANHKECFASFSYKEGDSRYGYSVNFREGEDGFYSESRTSFSMAKEIGKIISRVIGASKLKDVLAKKVQKK